MNTVMFVCGAILCFGSFYALRRTKDVIGTRFLRILVVHLVLSSIGGMGLIFSVLPYKNAQSDLPPLTLTELREVRERTEAP